MSLPLHDNKVYINQATEYNYLLLFCPQLFSMVLIKAYLLGANIWSLGQQWHVWFHNVLLIYPTSSPFWRKDVTLHYSILASGSFCNFTSCACSTLVKKRNSLPFQLQRYCSPTQCNVTQNGSARTFRIPYCSACIGISQDLDWINWSSLISSRLLWCNGPCKSTMFSGWITKGSKTVSFKITILWSTGKPRASLEYPTTT